MTALEIKLYSSTWELFVKYESADHRAPSFHLGIHGCYGTRKFQFHADGQNHPNKLGYGTELILCWLFLWNRSRLTQGVPHRHENMSCWSHAWSTSYVNMKSDYCHQYDNINVDLLYYFTFFQPHLCSHSRQVKSFVQTPARCMPTVPISNRTMWLSLLSQYFQDTPCWNPLGICTQRILNWGALKLGATLYQQSMAGDKYFFLLILDWQTWNAFYPIP